MIKKLIPSLVALLLLPALCWADTADIPLSGTQSYKAIRLTPEIYNQSNRSLSDLLIKDQSGNPVPYFLNSFESSTTDTALPPRPLSLIHSYEKDGDTFADYFTQENSQKDILATAITFRTSHSVFAKNIELYGSHDGTVWDFIQKDKLYRVVENEKLTLTFQKTQKYNYYRLQIKANAENIRFDQAALTYSTEKVNREFFTQSFTPRYEIEEDKKNKRTLIKVYGVKNLKINSVKLETDSQFKRTAYFASNRISKMIYQLSFSGNSYQDTTLAFKGEKTTNDFTTITIENGDDTPIQIKTLTLTYYTDEIIFKGATSGTYQLYFGNPNSTTPPSYDIANYKAMILKEGYDLLELKNIKIEKPIEEPPKKDYTLWFNLIIGAISIGLGYIIISKLKKSE